MVKYREILRLRAQGVSVTNTAFSVGCARSTVQRTCKRAKEVGLNWPLPEEIDDKEIYSILFLKDRSQSAKAKPDFNYVHKELLKKGVTLTLLWQEYCTKSVESGLEPLQYSSFTIQYRKWAQAQDCVMHIERKPGEQLMVDWAGKTMEVACLDTGEILPVYIFVACLPYSSYLYAQGFFKMDSESWLTAHINTLEHLGGVASIVIPDNLKTGVSKNTLDELVLNPSYRRLAEHYRFCVIPARPRKPRDKASVEAGVGLVTRQAIAPLRQHTFFSLDELNNSLSLLVEQINERPFQRREGSRASIFFGQEKDTLAPLPPARFEVYTTKTATVPYNYHISVLGQFYSVPFQLVRTEVEIRISKKTVSIFSNSKRVALHKRSYSQRPSYTTDKNHMPDRHKDFVEWSGDRFRAWGEKVGENTAKVIDLILRARPIEQQAYRSCRAVMALGQRHSAEILEEACQKALAIAQKPSYTTVKTIISALTCPDDKKSADDFAYLRGASHYEDQSLGGK